MLNILSVGLGGFVGAVCRYLIGLIPINEITTFPIKTFVINVIGCIVIGVITVAAARNTFLNPYMLLFLKVGLCGGLTFLLLLFFLHHWVLAFQILFCLEFGSLKS